jgi:hypothetical protein
MKKVLLIITATALLGLLALFGCGYKERGHANTPPEAPGDQTKVGIDTVAHPANINKDTIRVEE